MTQVATCMISLSPKWRAAASRTDLDRYLILKGDEVGNNAIDLAKQIEIVRVLTF